MVESIAKQPDIISPTSHDDDDDTEYFYNKEFVHKRKYS